MKRGIVVEGDPLTKGGIEITGSKVIRGSGTLIRGLFRPALIGDPVYCPIHGAGTVFEGDPKFHLNNKPVALDGHKASCGCLLMAKLVGDKVKIEDTHPTLKDSLDKECEKGPSALLKTKEKLKWYKKPLIEVAEKVVYAYCLQKEVSVMVKNFFKSTNNNSSQTKQNKLESHQQSNQKKPLDCTNNKYRGGWHEEMRKPIGDGKDSHHMPAKGAYKGTKMNPDGEAKFGPAIQMDPEDHEKTLSNGKVKGYKEYIAKQNALLKDKKLAEAFAMDIKNVRDIAILSGDPDKYECAIQEAEEYLKTLDPKDFK